MNVVVRLSPPWGSSNYRDESDDAAHRCVHPPTAERPWGLTAAQPPVRDASLSLVPLRLWRPCRNYTTLANAFRAVVASLPRVAGRNLYLQIGERAVRGV